jgi:site-specific DNA-adenine methylase
MNQDDFDNLIEDLSTEDLKKNLNQTNKELLNTLRERFTQNLLTSMIFFMFNSICKSEYEGFSNKESVNNQFFSYWFENIRKESKKEILEVNKKLKDEKMQYLSEISNFSLPTTEDYQSIYNKALLETKEFFQKNTKNN